MKNVKKENVKKKSEIIFLTERKQGEQEREDVSHLGDSVVRYLLTS